MINIYSRIKEISIFTPEKKLTNKELSDIYPDWSENKIFEKTGIKSRPIADESQTAADLAYGAAKNIFDNTSIKPGDVDFLILCTQAPDYFLPTTACLLQERLGLNKNTGALDVNLGCSGFVYGLSLAKGLIETGLAKCVLLLTADTYSKYIHPLDKSVRTLFGDAAAATVIVAEEDKNRTKPFIGPFVFGTDGRGAKNLIVETGAARLSKSDVTGVEISDPSGNTRSIDNLYMNGAEVMTFSLKEVPKAASNLLDKAKISAEEIDFFVLHQANKFMLDALRKKMKIDVEKMPIFVEEYGNTVSSTIPIALFEMKKNKLIKSGGKIMLLGFGVGYSWAGCLVDF